MNTLLEIAAAIQELPKRDAYQLLEWMQACLDTSQNERVKIEDFMTYKKRVAAERSAAIDEMVALSEELGLYD